MIKKRHLWCLLLGLGILLVSCGPDSIDGASGDGRVLYVSINSKIKTLDPALGSDLTSANMIASFYDTPLQYDYLARPYKLMPSMLVAMPKVSADQLTYTCKLRDDLFFPSDPCFKNSSKDQRRITSKDVIFSLLRIADRRVHSTGFWLFRNKIKGFDEFRDISGKAAPGDMAIYDQGCSGLEVVDDRTFAIHLKKPYPRLLYVLAMPYASVVSRQAVEYYGENFAMKPVGSGPFLLKEWIRNYRIILDRNPGYRQEFFPEAVNPADRKRQLPLIDRVICYMVRQPLASWLLFLQGELDMSALNRENFDAVVGDNKKLIPSLVKRGISMVRVPEFQINYVSFCFTDPLLAGNLDLRKAISLAYDVETRVKHFNYRIIPAHGPIPPGVPGYDPKFKNPFSEYNVEKAKELMRKAGFPDGIDPKTGEALELTFDQMGNSNQHRQIAELMVDDMKKIGIKIIPNLNNKPRFLQKSRKGQLQLFRLGWIGDYPDAENFLQLFYGPNAGSSNRTFIRDEKFDRMYEEVVTMPDCPKRTKKYSLMAQYLTSQCPWVFESHPIAYRLLHSWLENYVPHDFAFSRWKYLSLDPKKREESRREFVPIEMKDLRN